MSDHEHDTLRAEVRAFRSVARWLTDPTAGLLADLAQAEKWLNLTSALPLVDVDLFAAVPDVVHRGTSTTTSGAVRVRQADAAGLPPLPRQARSVSHQEAPRPTATSGGSEVRHQAPVFSFRQREVQRGVRQDATWLSAAQHHVPGQPLPPEASAQEHNSPVNGPMQQSAGPEEAGGDTSVYAGRSRPALAQLAQVAEEVAQQLHPHRPSDASPDGRSAPEPPEPRRTPELRALSQLERLVNQALRLTSRASGTRVSREEPAGRDVHGTQPPPWLSLQTQDRAASGAEIAGSSQTSQQHVLHLINSHVDHLLSPDMAAPLSNSREDTPSDLAGALGAEHGAGQPPGYTGHTSVAPLAETGEGIAGAAPRTPTPADEFSLTENPGAPQVDAASLAALVNDVLIEQARRHGVDLS